LQLDVGAADAQVFFFPGWMRHVSPRTQFILHIFVTLF
jgi:hypothetical protein